MIKQKKKKVKRISQTDDDALSCFGMNEDMLIMMINECVENRVIKHVQDY